MRRRLSSVVEQRFCKPLVGSSSLSAGTNIQGVYSGYIGDVLYRRHSKHRYAMVLHIDQPHPHVQVVVKAISEQGVRLYIRKATLREWRTEFARHLRSMGIAANATDRGVRGETRSPKRDGIYRAEQRGESRYTHARAEAVAAELLKGNLRVELGKAKLLETRREVERAHEPWTRDYFEGRKH
jgi:type IV secretion system T-DNA border endonuclease VirD2